MKYEDKRPPVPRLMRPEDVNRAVRRTSPRKNRRARPSTPPPSVEEHKNSLNSVVRQSADKTRQKIEDEKAKKIAEEKEKQRRIQEEKKKKETERKARIRSSIDNASPQERQKGYRSRTTSIPNGVSNQNVAESKTVPTTKNHIQEKDVSVESESSIEKTPLYSRDPIKKSSYNPLLENNKEKKEYDEIVADPNAIYENANIRNTNKEDNVQKGVSKTKTSAPSPSELARTIENSKKNIKPKRTGLNISVITMSLFSIFLASSLSVLGAYSYGIYKDSTTEKVENAAYEKGVQDSTGDPTVETVMRVNPEKMTEMIMSSPNANFPPNPVLTDFKLTGYSIPGGDEGRGRANINFCYAANDIEGKRSGRAYFVSDDANAQEPFWRVDAVNITQDPCN